MDDNAFDYTHWDGGIFRAYFITHSETGKPVKIMMRHFHGAGHHEIEEPHTYTDYIDYQADDRRHWRATVHFDPQSRHFKFIHTPRNSGDGGPHGEYFLYCRFADHVWKIEIQPITTPDLRPDSPLIVVRTKMN